MKWPFVNRTEYEREVGMRRLAEVDRNEYQREANDLRARAIKAEVNVSVTSERLHELNKRMTAIESESRLPDLPLDRCPDCGSEEWVRIASIVHAQHDGKRERVSLGGSRLMCLACTAQYNLLPGGLVKPPMPQPQEPPAGASPSRRDRIPVKLPGGKSL